MFFWQQVFSLLRSSHIVAGKWNDEEYIKAWRRLTFGTVSLNSLIFYLYSDSLILFNFILVFLLTKKNLLIPAELAKNLKCIWIVLPKFISSITILLCNHWKEDKFGRSSIFTWLLKTWRRLTCWVLALGFKTNLFSAPLNLVISYLCSDSLILFNFILVLF
jgi:hypothetical protein